MQQKSPKILKQYDNATINPPLFWLLYPLISFKFWNGEKEIIRVGAHVRPRGVQVVAGQSGKHKLDGENIHQRPPGGSQRISQQLASFRERLVDRPEEFFLFYKMFQN